MMGMQQLLLRLSLGAVLTTVAVSYNHAQNQLASWLKENGGFFSDKIEFQLLDKGNVDSPTGIFAMDDIARGETIVIIPRSLLLTSEGSEEMCDTARNLLKQKELGDASKYAPYVNHVFDPKHANMLPMAWSNGGKKLLHEIIGNELPPFDVTGNTFQETCSGTVVSDLQEEAWQTVVRRAWDPDTLVPIFDMFNHRNGKWHNLDSTKVSSGEDVVVFASRNVEKGEQLYLSYNECADCIGYAWTYVLPDILKDYGFVEQYPRRWYIEECTFELDENKDTGEIEVTFLSGEPEHHVIQFMRGQLKRLVGLQDYVTTEVAKLESEHERFMSLEYYNALMTAFECALREAESEKELCSMEDHNSKTCALREYDPLDSLPDELQFSYVICDFERISQMDSYDEIFRTESLYQDMVFTYSPMRDDTCLFMNGHLHACSSLRPHYHEVFVHYPARFVDEVKRVAFIGGGDNMIVHEILKYPSLELVVGMELDQTVVRSSFKMFGTQPHFDDERLQWWFGDGSKSLLMLPEEYYGTFDVVYVDLQNDVVDMIEVAGDIPITEAALLLLKPDGVIARNEDWEFGSAKPFSKYTVDLYYVDVPVFCYQQVTMGSNAVDFLTKEPKDHGIKTKYMQPLGEVEDPFEAWFNYRKIDNFNNSVCKEPGEPDKALLTDEMKSNYGILLIIEAEKVTTPLGDASFLQERISNALKHTGFSSSTALVTPDEDGYEILFVMKEGYAIVRAYTKLKYCAFDLLLWSKTNKQEEAKVNLIASVGSEEVSSYRVLTSGMFGASDKKETNRGPVIKESCQRTPESVDTVVEQSVIDTVLGESTSLLQNKSNLVIVLCAEESIPCTSLQVLKKSDNILNVIPVWSCPNLEGTSLDAMVSCESKTLQYLQELGHKIDAIVIDSNAPKAMGSIIHKLLSSLKTRNQVLSENHVVISASVDPADSKWRKVFLDRFRTDIVKYDPAYRAQVMLGSLELNVFVSGDDHFYSHLMNLLASIEDTIHMSPDAKSITNGFNNYIPDFEPSRTFVPSDYDNRESLRQWNSQDPHESQTILSFRAEEKLSTAGVKDSLEKALVGLNGSNKEASLTVFDNVGDGSVLVGYWSGGNIVAVWDGRQSVCANLRTEQSLNNFEASLVWDTVAKDKMPRGSGKVVNFKEELGSREERPHWAIEGDDD